MGRRVVTTTDGEKVEIVSPGEQNRDAGPDFLNAMVRIGETTWAGSVEVHVKSSDWDKHRHSSDLAYDNVVLHAVYEYDGMVRRSTGEVIPAVTLKEHIPKRAYQAYRDFLNNHLWVPCANELASAPAERVAAALEAVSMERVRRRSEQIRQMVFQSKGDWNQAFYESLAGTLGARLNKEPFEMLTRQTPLQTIMKNRSSLSAVEALLFGQAGFLDQDFREEYPLSLSIDYLHIKNKYSLSGLPAHLWKFLRLRPGNFPTIRIAQMASLLFREPLLLGVLVDDTDTRAWRQHFQTSVSEYWKTHYHFDTLSVRSDKNLGDDTLDLILINSVVPFLYTFGLMHGNKAISDRAIQHLSELAAETNSILRTFRYFGLECQNALQSQGALELKKQWCDMRRCLDCRIGKMLMEKELLGF